MTLMPEGLPEPRRMQRPRKKDDARDSRTHLALPAYEKELRVIKAIRMHRMGYSYDEIAADMGYASGNTIRNMIKDAIKEASVAEADDLKRWALRKQMEQLAITQDTIDNPGIMFDVKGMPLIGPGGRYQPDLDTRTKAQTEYRHNIESLRRLVGADAPVQKHVTIEQQARQDAINNIFRQLNAASETTLTAEVIYESAEQETGGESDEAPWQSPRDAGDSAGGGEGGEEEQENGGDQAH